jgi:hypothetical protein
MKNASKMARYMMLRPRGENGGDMRGEDYPRGEYNGGRTDNRPEQRGGGGYEPENRSRDSRGRYTTRNAYGPYNGGESGDEMESRRGMRSEYGEETEDRYVPQSRMNIIGFEDRRYPMPVWEAGAHYGGSQGESKTMRGHGSSKSEEFTPELAHEWTKHMKNGDGTVGPHWTMEQTKQLAQQRGIDAEPAEFFAVMNAMYSDYYEVARKHNVHSTEFYADLAKAWLKDKDAVPNKAAMYYECIVKH